MDSRLRGNDNEASDEKPVLKICLLGNVCLFKINVAVLAILKE
jgi:hypothetical protein